jgi:hypothetical protein
MNIEVLRNYHKKRTKVERRKMEGMNQFGIQYIYTWKCRNETLCVDLKNSFFQKQNRKVK